MLARGSTWHGFLQLMVPQQYTCSWRMWVSNVCEFMSLPGADSDLACFDVMFWWVMMGDGWDHHGVRVMGILFTDVACRVGSSENIQEVAEWRLPCFPRKNACGNHERRQLSENCLQIVLNIFSWFRITSLLPDSAVLHSGHAISKQHEYFMHSVSFQTKPSCISYTELSQLRSHVVPFLWQWHHVTIGEGPQLSHIFDKQKQLDEHVLKLPTGRARQILTEWIIPTSFTGYHVRLWFTLLPSNIWTFHGPTDIPLANCNHSLGLWFL